MDFSVVTEQSYYESLSESHFWLWYHAGTGTNMTDAEEDGMHWEPLQKEILEENISVDKHGTCAEDPCLPTDQPGLDSEDISAEVLDGARFSESVFDFENMASMEDFAMVVNGSVVNSKLPKHLKAKYYKLCCSQKSVLHKNLLRGLSSKLAAGIISETVNIADAMRDAKITTSVQNFTVWGKTLKAFKDLGMDVGFLQARLDRLTDIAIKSKRMEDARRERAVAEEEIRVLEAKALEVKSKISKLDAEITILDKNEGMFRELSAAPWWQENNWLGFYCLANEGTVDLFLQCGIWGNEQLSHTDSGLCANF